MPTLKAPAGGLTDLTIDQVELTLAERAGPVFGLRLATGQDLNTARLRPWLAAAPAGVDVLLEFRPGEEMPLYLLGFRLETPAADLPAGTRDWFDQRPAGADQYLWVVAQRGRDADAWGFLAATAEDKIAEPPGNLHWDSLFGPEACVLRVGAWTNRCFVEHLVTLLTERTAAV
jgi:hypothetical protein